MKENFCYFPVRMESKRIRHSSSFSFEIFFSLLRLLTILHASNKEKSDLFDGSNAFTKKKKYSVNKKLTREIFFYIFGATRGLKLYSNLKTC